MNKATRILPAVAGVVFALAARAAETEESRLEESAQPSRWRISAGARFAPGVKTKASISSRAVIDAAGRLRGANALKDGGSLPSGSSTSTERHSATSNDESSEAVDMLAEGRIDFPDGISFIDMDDTTLPPEETWYWHFDSSAAFDDATGSITISSSAGEGAGSKGTSSSRSSSSEQILADVTSSHETDLWGGDIEIGYDFYVDERLSLGLGLGATLYRSEDAIRAAGRSGRATSATTSTSTSQSSTEMTVFTDPNYAYAGAMDDLRNDDGSYGAGDREGDENIYGGVNPSLTLTDGSVTRTTATETRKDTTTRRQSRTIDVAAEGDVETQEIRLALQPAWKATDWLMLRGSVGAVATRVSVDTDATILVNGTRFTTVSGDDSDWVFAGLCGLDAVFSPCESFDLFVGADIRLGNNKFDYEAGLVRGEVELARCTFRAGVAISF